MRLLLPRTVIVFGLVSFLNDTASEMIAPLLPIFLVATLGSGPAIVGLIEGVSEATSSLLKLISGWLADRGWNAKGLIVGGYGAANLARPLIGVAASWTLVLVLRFVDRIGKGLRTAPRDAMISESAAPGQLGRAFGFHRSMDHAGAMLGPIIAFVLLSYGLGMREVFLYSAIPGALLLGLLIFGLPASRIVSAAADRPSWSVLNPKLKGLVIAAAGLSLATTPEVFLVLWAQSRAIPLEMVPLLWAAASGTKMLVALPAGNLSDKLGCRPVVIFGWLTRIAILVSLAFAGSGMITVWCLFLAYAGSLALTEAAERALLGAHAPKDYRGTVFGLYHLVSGVFVLPGAVLFGIVWQNVSQHAAFIMAAGLTFVAALVFLAYARDSQPMKG